VLPNRRRQILHDQQHRTEGRRLHWQRWEKQEEEEEEEGVWLMNDYLVLRHHLALPCPMINVLEQGWCFRNVAVDIQLMNQSISRRLPPPPPSDVRLPSGGGGGNEAVPDGFEQAGFGVEEASLLMQMMTGGFLTNPKEHYVWLEPSWNQDEGCIFFAKYDESEDFLLPPPPPPCRRYPTSTTIQASSLRAASKA
jgi:hypothetical protein